MATCCQRCLRNRARENTLGLTETPTFSLRPLLHFPRCTLKNVVSPAAIAAGLTEYWSPRVVAEVDDSYVKVAKVKGTLAWHAHDNEDELFLVLKGRLKIEFEDGVVELNEGESYVVPKGVQHNPVAEEECHILLIERKTTLHTGTVITEKTRSLQDQLRPT
jgi:mannose-6-phosphate isomerase-like protein (cupin superfamily)